ncbi:MAG: nucleotidyltransferase domain-containing protein [Phycisphaerales bacterium]|nr:nucleotidyltransferase domain-containing protein [Phycisphaerales bacterium]
MAPEAPISNEALVACCRRWGVARLWLFGSFAAGTARADSDADVLIEFQDDSEASTWDWPQMQDELRLIFRREVDLLSVGVLRNPWRARSILASRKLLYAA